MVGGLLLSHALTLFITPVVYLYLDRLSRWRKRPNATPTPAGIVTPARFGTPGSG